MAVHGPFADPNSTVPGGDATVTTTIDATGMAVGTHTVRITGRVLMQTTTFKIKDAYFG